MKRHRFSLLAASAATLLSCSLLKSFDGFEGGRAVDAEDGGGSALDGDGGDASRDDCPPSWPAPPPASADGPDIAPLVLADKELQVLTPPGGPRGLNVDRLCTCPGVAACRSADLACDADGGIDNAAATLFDQFVRAGQSLVDDDGLRMAKKLGKYALLFRITSYNGRPDDPDVTVSLLNGYELSNGPAEGPRYDGTDEWKVDVESLPDGKLAPYSSAKAWVSGSELVAELPFAVLKVRVPSTTGLQLIRLEIRDLRLHGRLEPTLGSYAITRATLAGRWSAEAALKQVQINKVCQGSSIYDAVKATVCRALDVPLEVSEDGRDVPCRGISIGLDLAAAPAKLGPVGTPTDVEGCAYVEDDCTN